MISLLRNLPADKAGIYQKLLEENKAGSPFRDYIWVEQTISDDPTVPLGTEYMRNLSALQIILRTYGTLIPAIHPFSTDMLSLMGHCFNKAFKSPIPLLIFFRKICLSIIFIITVSFEATAQKGLVPVINQQEQHLFHSTTNGKSYHLTVSLPPHYSPADSVKYPVLYLLDGSFSFPIAHAARTLLDMFGEIEEVIIVGIGDEWEQSYSPWISSRWTDYTPSADPASDSNPAFLNLFDLEEGALLSGGGPVFLDMIQNEIIPFIDGQYKTTQDRGIAGHSFGGLFAGYCLLKASNAFSRFGINSPSFWWNKDEIFALEQVYSNQYQDLNAQVFISVGSKEGTSMVSKMLAFSDSLRSRNYPGLKLTSHIFEDETHNSVVAASISRTLRVLYGK